MILLPLLIMEAQIFRGSNYRVYPSNVSQTEVVMCVSPADTNVIFISANAIRFNPLFISEGIYVTSDGGNSWFGSDTCTGPNLNNHGGDPGIAIDKNGTFVITRRDFSVGLYSHFSTNMGKTWSGRKTITTDDLERANLISDTNRSSSYYGRTYGSWVRYAPPYRVNLTYTDNSGFSFSTPAIVNNPTQRGQGGDITIGSNGEVYITWAGVSGTSPYTEQLVGFAKSTDGGVSFTALESAYLVNGIQGVLSQKQNIRVNGLPVIDSDESGGVRNGCIYIITTQKNKAPAGSDADIILNRSTDGGLTWSQGIRVNQDNINNGKTQFFPALHVDKYGGVNVLYYDDRFTTSDSCGVMLSRSTDGGDTWKDYLISDHNFKPTPIGGLGQGYQGDNIALKSVNNTLWPAWMDNSSGVYQVWTSPISLSSLTTVDNVGENIPSGFELTQNYPNPFNPSTVIEYSIPEAGFVSLKVYDVRGKEVSVLVNEEKSKGSYLVSFNADNLSSGIYFYKIRTEQFTETKKMLLLR